MIENFVLEFSDSKQIKISGKGVTVLVGANNSGKSLALREIETLFNSGSAVVGTRIVKAPEPQWPTLQEVEGLIAGRAVEITTPHDPGHVHISRRKPSQMGPGGHLSTISMPMVKNFVENKMNYEWLLNQVYSHWMVRLDGRSRFDLVSDRPQGDLSGVPDNMLAHLFIDDQLRAKVRDAVFEAFGIYFVIDPTNGGQLRIRLSSDPPQSDEQSLNAEAREFHKKARYIREASDGVQAFVGIVMAAISGDYRYLLIDEPEAFLHPPLARKLGRQLGALSVEAGGALIAATHSADFLMGCIQGARNVSVVRLEYQSGKSRGRIVDPSAIAEMYSNPLMRNANVISGLFYDGVVVTESDSDRVFYSEVYNRLTEIEPGYPSILFINAQNKQTVKTIVKPLREFGIAAVAITDIDVIKEGSPEWPQWMEAIQFPQALRSGLGSHRDNIKKCFDAAGIDMKTGGGVEALPGDDRAAGEQFLKQLQEYGLFVVPRGELEHWLPHLEIVRKKGWVAKMLDRFGSDPTDPAYVAPSSGDVWDFMRALVAWVKDPSRKGVA